MARPEILNSYTTECPNCHHSVKLFILGKDKYEANCKCEHCKMRATFFNPENTPQATMSRTGKLRRQDGGELERTSKPLALPFPAPIPAPALTETPPKLKAKRVPFDTWT